MADATEQINGRVPAGTNERLARRAQAEKISKNKLINQAIESYLSRSVPERDE
jgi:predicted HicB family RNase H-like nuclease